MLLAIDSGNTNTTFAVFDGETVRGSWRTSRTQSWTADEYVVWLSQLMGLEGLKRADIEAVVIANVVPDKAYDLEKLCRKYFGTSPLVVGAPGVEIGVKSLIEHPSETGADRLVNALSGHRSYGGPLIVIDFGTATTFDVVDREGNYRGGAIAPGINLSLDALYMAAAKLPSVAIARPPKAIGTSTVTAMQSGIFNGYVGLIEGLVQRIRHEFETEIDPGSRMKVIATGGLAPLFAEAIEVIEATDGDLTLRGLLHIYRMNQPR